MNILVFNNLLILLFVRSIGLGIAIDFYYKTKEAKFKLFILGWVSWIISAVSAIYSGFINDQNLIELVLFLNALFATLGSFFYVWSFYTFFFEVSNKSFLFILPFLIILPTIIFITVNFRFAIILSSFFLSIICVSVYILLIKKKIFKERIGLDLKWIYVLLITFAFYFPLSIYNIYQGLEYGLYNSNDTSLIIIYYLLVIISYILLIILLIHVEYNISYNQRFVLKDKYSHDLGNTLHFIIGYNDTLSQKEKFKEKELLDLQNLFKAKCKEASDLLREIREL